MGDLEMVSYENFFLFILISILSPVICLLILIIFNAFEKQIYLLEVENSKVNLEKELETTKYIKLNQQIHPHFLFNALNSMLGLLRLKRYDVLNESFEHMVLYLRSKYNHDQTLYTVKNEIEHTNHYLAIQKLRFGERICIKIEMEKDTEELLIIPYLIQTLVENSFKHGIDNIEGQGEIQIYAGMKEEKLLIVVQDNGPGFQTHPLEGTPGQGLNNVYNRLQLLFGEKAQMQFMYSNPKEQLGGKVIALMPKMYNETEKQ